VARAAYFPSISLTGYLGSESVALSDLFTGPAGIGQAAIALGQPIYQGGRLEAQVKAANARERQALARYQFAVQNAFREVRDALVAQVKARERLDAERDRAAALMIALRFARLRYENGLSSQLEVLDAERNLLAAEQNRVDALRAQRAAIADLFKALGGVWS
jgi:multidrug efflux system outer membrane protein